MLTEVADGTKDAQQRVPTRFGRAALSRIHATVARVDATPRRTEVAALRVHLESSPGTNPTERGVHAASARTSLNTFGSAHAQQTLKRPEGRAPGEYSRCTRRFHTMATGRRRYPVAAATAGKRLNTGEKPDSLVDFGAQRDACPTWVAAS